MGKVNQLWQDQVDAAMEAYLAEHPGTPVDEAYDAIIDRFCVEAPDEPDTTRVGV